MPSEILSAIPFIAGMLAAMIISSKAVFKGTQLAQQIVKCGQAAEGKVLRVWRPPVAGSFARIYFEFEPEGLGKSVQCCHVDRRLASDCAASLPAVGAAVGVRYLVENPHRAVIARLVSRFSR